MDHSEYIDMDDYVMKSSAPSPTNPLPPAECPYMGLPYAHLKLNKNVSIIQEKMKITTSGKKPSTVSCAALLKGSWLLCYSSAGDLMPKKFFFVENLTVPSKPEQSLELTLSSVNSSSQAVKQTLHFDSGTVREMWIKAIREELPVLEDGVYDDPHNLMPDDHLYKTIFDYDIPRMPPKRVSDGPGDEDEERQQQLSNKPQVSPNRTEFQLKYQEIKEQLASQLQQKKQQKGGCAGTTDRMERSPSASSPQKKFGRFISIFRSSASAAGSTSPPQEVNVSSKKSTPDKTAKIMRYKRNTTIFSPDYEIVGS